MLAVGAIQVLILLIALVRAKFLSFAIGPSGYGIVGTIDQIIVALVGVGSLGIPFVAIKILSRNLSGTRDEFEHAYAGFVAGLLTLGVLTAAIGILLALFAPLAFGSQLAPYRFLLAIAIVAVPSLMLNNLLPNALAASNFGRRAALYTLIVQGVLLVSTIAGAIADGVRGIYVASVVGGTLLTIGALIALRSTLGSPLRGGFSWILGQVRRERTLLVYAFWSYASTAVFALSLSGLRTSVFSNDGAAAAGLFGAALNLALTVGAVVAPMSNLLLTPFLNRGIARGDKMMAADDFALKMLAVVVVIALPLVLFPQLAMTLLFSPAFRPGASMLFALVAWQCLAQAVNVYTQLLIGFDDFAFGCFATIIGNGAIFLLAPSVTAEMGVSGPAFLLVAGSLACGLASAWRLGQKFKVPLNSRVLFRLAFALLAIAGSRSVARTFPEFTVLGFAARVGYAAVALAILAMLLTGAEKEWMALLIRGRLKRAS